MSKRVFSEGKQRIPVSLSLHYCPTFMIFREDAVILMGIYVSRNAKQHFQVQNFIFERIIWVNKHNGGHGGSVHK
jgi:hypothetical protein